MKVTANSKSVLALVGVVAFMTVMAWSAVPFYNWFCKVTGYGGIGIKTRIIFLIMGPVGQAATDGIRADHMVIAGQPGGQFAVILTGAGHPVPDDNRFTGGIAPFQKMDIPALTHQES